MYLVVFVLYITVNLFEIIIYKVLLLFHSKKIIFYVFIKYFLFLQIVELDNEKRYNFFFNENKKYKKKKLQKWKSLEK